MLMSIFRKIGPPGVALLFLLGLFLMPARRTPGADHGDSPMVDEDRPADIDDVYAFLDPNDNSKLVVIVTSYGFIVPGEALNFGAFDPNVRYLVELETTGDARPDLAVDIRFSPRTASGVPQRATIILPFGQVFTAPTTASTFGTSANPFTVTTDPTTGVSFFAGVTDDPFFFDVVGFNRFVASIKAGAPDPTQLQRGRDVFAGYNTAAIALSIPVSLLRVQPTAGNSNGSVIGVEAVTQRQARTVRLSDGTVASIGGFRNIDRMGNPAVNTVFIPFARKDEYNVSTPQDDADGKFAGDIVATLQSLGTDSTSIGILASVAVTNGDYLRLNLTQANTGPGGGNNSGAGFPNGRRLQDDVVDTLLFLVANRNTLGDGVNANDVAFGNTFPFLAPPQQPRNSGVIDDNTRN